MAQLSYILQMESENKNEIRLYSEGLFYKAYEYSAYLFVKHIAAFRVKKRLVKSLKTEMVSIGFPKSSLSRLFADFDVGVLEDEKNGEVVVCSFDNEPFVDECFCDWKREQPFGETDDSKCLNKVQPATSEIVQLINSFQIEQKTPMECMLFLSELKKHCSK